MSVQFAPAVVRLEMLVWPASPPKRENLTYAFRRGETRNWELTDYGRDAAAMAQRVLLSYVLGYENRAELACRYYLGQTQVGAIVRGKAHRWLTDPIRERLLANGIGSRTMRRSPARAGEVRSALERLAAQASELLGRPYSEAEAAYRERLALDLYLISGAWREDEP